MKNLYRVKLKRTSYGGATTIETRELFAESPEDINTYRLGGFQRDTVTVLEATKIRDGFTIEVEADIERNEIDFTVDANEHIENTLEHDGDLEQELVNAAEEQNLDIEDVLLARGYVEAVHDNSYNWSADFSDNIMFKVFVPKGTSDWIYSDDAIVLVWLHYGLDARTGYGFKGVYKPSHHEGLCYFLDGHVTFCIIDMDDNDVRNFSGEGAGYRLTETGYKLSKFDKTTREIEVTKDGETYKIYYYHPAEGI